MRFALSLSIALLYAGAAQAENDLSQFQPSLYCDPVPEGRVIIEENGRKEIAGKLINYPIKDTVLILEERYISMENQKCAVKAYTLYEEHFAYIIYDNKKVDISLHEIFKASINGGPFRNSYYYNASFNELLSKKSKIDLCDKKTNDAYEIKKYSKKDQKIFDELSKCYEDVYNDLDRRGFYGYSVMPQLNGKLIIDGELIKDNKYYFIYGFYYLDGEFGILNKPSLEARCNILCM